MGCAAKHVVGVYVVLSLVQLALSITLIVYGTRGLNLLDQEQSRAGIPYPVGALLTGAVYVLVGLSSLAMVALWLIDSTAVEYVACIFCVFVYLGMPSFILGMIFTIAFGIANCKQQGGSYDEQTGFCSYEQNIDENYNIAVVTLVLILILFLTTVVDIVLLCNYSDLQSDADFESHSGMGTNTVGTSSGTGGGSTASGGHRGNPTLKKMVQDRERRQDADRQRRLGVPEHRITRKFFGPKGH